MDYKVIISDVAVDELIEITRFIARENSQAALANGTWLILKAESLKAFPHRGRKASESVWKDCRIMTVARVRIVYRVNEEMKTVEVLHFWHSARGTPQE